MIDVKLRARSSLLRMKVAGKRTGANINAIYNHQDGISASAQDAIRCNIVCTVTSQIVARRIGQLQPLQRKRGDRL